MSSNFSQIRTLIAELVALECLKKKFQRVIMGKWCLHASLFLGNKDMFKNYKRFDFWHVQMADIGGTKPWKNNCSLIWKLFKFLMTLLAGLFEMKGCWHIGLRWAIVALWATCFLYLSHVWFIYRNDPKFSDRYAWANSADPEEQSDQGLSRSSLIWVCTVCHSVSIVWTHYCMVEPHSSNFRVITTNVLGVRIFRKFAVTL